MSFVDRRTHRHTQVITIPVPPPYSGTQVITEQWYQWSLMGGLLYNLHLIKWRVGSPPGPLSGRNSAYKIYRTARTHWITDIAITLTLNHCGPTRGVVHVSAAVCAMSSDAVIRHSARQNETIRPSPASTNLTLAVIRHRCARQMFVSDAGFMH